MNNMTKYRIIHHALECEPELSEHYFISGCLISLEPLQDDQKIIEGGLARCLCKQGDGLMAVQEPAVHSPTSCGPKPEDEKCKHKWLDEPNYQCIYCGSLPTREEKENLRDPVGCSCTKEQKEERKKALAPSSPQWEEELKEFRRKYEGANYWTTVSTPMIEDMLKDIRTLLEKTREEEGTRLLKMWIPEAERKERQALLAKLKGEVGGMKRHNLITQKRRLTYSDVDDAYNKALSDILKLLENIEI